MPLIYGKTIIGLSVETETGDVLGKVCNFEIDIESHNIVNYHVKVDNLLKKFTEPELIINVNQVISVSKNKMIVMGGEVRGGFRGEEASPSII